MESKDSTKEDYQGQVIRTSKIAVESLESEESIDNNRMLEYRSPLPKREKLEILLD